MQLRRSGGVRSSSLFVLLVLLRGPPTDAAGSSHFLAAISGGGSASGTPRQPSDPCYDGDSDSDYDDATATRCRPDFVNAAFGRDVAASSTCGSPAPDRYCTTGRQRDGREGRRCRVCDDADAARRHPTAYLTDLNNPSNVTCWVSRPLQRTSDNVTLTLSLGKKFEVRVPGL